MKEPQTTKLDEIARRLRIDVMDQVECFEDSITYDRYKIEAHIKSALQSYANSQVEAFRERAAMCCDARGAEEQNNYGATRGTQNYFRAREAIRQLPIGEE